MLRNRKAAHHVAIEPGSNSRLSRIKSAPPLVSLRVPVLDRSGHRSHAGSERAVELAVHTCGSHRRTPKSTFRAPTNAFVAGGGVRVKVARAPQGNLDALRR